MDDNEVTRHNAYTRVNPSGHKELVVKKKGKQDEETLNELTEELDEILFQLESVAFGGTPALSAEQPMHTRLVGSSGDRVRENGDSITNMTSTTAQAADGPELSRAKNGPLTSTIRGKDNENKYNAGYQGDRLDYGATHNESFTGTGAIAVPPGSYETIDSDEDEEEETSQSENIMSQENDAVINEWLPEFSGGEYDPGDYEMPSAPGNGVANKKPKQDNTGKHPTDTTSHGKEWPRKHNETAAMCDVDDDGVEHKSQGGHESSVGEPTDGHQDEVGHNWPDEAKNSGGGVAEPFEGNRWSDGGTLQGGSGQNEGGNSGRKQSMPKEGPITGTSGPQYGQPHEGWTPDGISTLMDDVDHGVNLQALFDNYANGVQAVCVEDFQELCNAHGIGILLDEAALLELMSTNRTRMFYEQHDASGIYWLAQPISEEHCDDDDEEEDEDCVSEGRRVSNRRPFNEDLGPDAFDDSEFGPGDMGGLGDEGMGGMGPNWSGVDDFFAGQMDDLDDEMGLGPEAAMPDLGDEMDDMPPGIGDMGDVHLGGFDDPELGGEEDDLPPGWGDEESEVPVEGRVIQNSPQIAETLSMFIRSAKSIIENNQEMSPSSVANALNHSWLYHAGRINPQTVPTKVRGTLSELARRFPGFKPMFESGSHVMEKQGGSAIGDGGANNKSDHLPDQPGPDEMHQHGSKENPLKHKHKNDYTDTPEVKGTAKGMTGRGNRASTVSEQHQAAPAAGQATTAPQQRQQPPQQAAAAPQQRQQPPQQQAATPNAAAGGGNAAAGGQAAQPQAQQQDPNAQATQAGGAQQVRENVSVLSKHVNRQIKEGARALRGGKFRIHFNVAVNESGQQNRTKMRSNLAEALADVEEVLQFHRSNDVMLEATFVNNRGVPVLKRDIGMLNVRARQPIVLDNMAVFRFRRNAELFANQMVNEGYTCRVQRHNWGSAVAINEMFAFDSDEDDFDEGGLHQGMGNSLGPPTPGGMGKHEGMDIEPDFEDEEMDLEPDFEDEEMFDQPKMHPGWAIGGR